MKINYVDKLPSEDGLKKLEYGDLKRGDIFLYLRKDTGYCSLRVVSDTLDSREMRQHIVIDSGLLISVITNAEPVTLYEVEIYAKERK